MNKKQLRKELEVSLVKTIEDLLISVNSDVAKKVNDITLGAAKIIAKKFYKNLKEVNEKKASDKKKKAVKKPQKSAPKKSNKPAVKKAK